MSQHIPEKLREFVAMRAGFRCEYCRMPQKFAGYSFQCDHIVARKHGGQTHADNLCNCCGFCNGHKGTDFGTIEFVNQKNQIIRFFNPRIDNLFAHFKVENGLILPKTKIGRATIKILNFNSSYDIEFRRGLMSLGLFP